jgi:hypothetical protein
MPGPKDMQMKPHLSDIQASDLVHVTERPKFDATGIVTISGNVSAGTSGNILVQAVHVIQPPVVFDEKGNPGFSQPKYIQVAYDDVPDPAGEWLPYRLVIALGKGAKDLELQLRATVVKEEEHFQYLKAFPITAGGRYKHDIEIAEVGGIF